MTSRLKRKLDDLEEAGINLNESFCQIGTPLPSLADTKKDKNEFVPVWKQEVRDENGRQRFHGAFTGGFSAGYHNTVGSKEGFTPQSFISSRTNRAKDRLPPSSSSSTNGPSGSKYKAQTAEDFMDEEDLEDLRNARTLENTDAFRDPSGGMGKSADELLGIGGSATLSSSLASLIQPASSSIGTKMLIKLGWRPGQGIGPRVSSRKLRLQDAKLRGVQPVSKGNGGGAGIGLESGAGADDGDDIDMEGEEAKKHTFAPRDTKLLVFDNKTGKEGLGFVQGQGMGAGTSAARRTGADIEMGDSLDVGGGFGLGPDGADEDDVDIYDGSTSKGGNGSRRGAVERSGRLMAYDDMEVDDGEGVILLGQGPGAARRPKAQPSRLVEEDQIRKTNLYHKRVFRLVNPNIKTWNDGRPLQPGFELDSSATAQDRWFDFPPIPFGWTPKPSRVWNKGSRWDKKEKVDENKQKEAMEGARPGWRQLTADQRGEVLGEGSSKPASLPGPGASVFEYMSSKEKQRLADFLQSTKAPAPVAEPAQSDNAVPAGFDMDDLIVPPLSPRTASAALKGFIPFGDDQEKQDRYTSYLRSQMLNTKEPIPKLFPSWRSDIVNKELSDFAKSAAMFKPMSFAMSNRFTSSTVSAQDLVQPKPGLHMPNPDKLEEWNDTSKKAEEPAEILTPRQEAARAGLYGPLTRVVDNWAPNKLLCKRFGVQDPYPEGMPGADKPTGNASTPLGTRPLLTAGPNDISWQDKFIHTPAPPGSETAGSSSSAREPGSRQPTSLAEVGLADDETQGKDILTYEKPAMDIFKAIFASDGEDDDDDGELESEEEVSLVPGPTASTSVSTVANVAAIDVDAPISVPSRGKAGEYIPSVLENSTGTTSTFETYKPTFALRREVEPAQDTGTNNLTNVVPKAKSKKEKKREKTKSKVLMSFDVGDMGDEEDPNDGEVAQPRRKDKDRPKEKRHKKREGDSGGASGRGALEEEDEWVEKEVVVPMVAPSMRSGRATAADFME